MKRSNRDAVLRVLTEHAPRSMHAAEVADRVGAPKRDADRVLEILEDLAASALVTQMPGRRFRANREAREEKPVERSRFTLRGRPNEIEGRITLHPNGFGFVAAEDGGPDVFIARPNLGGALQGDKVRVNARPSAKGREGEVVAVVTRGLSIITGTLRRAAGNAWIDPDDHRVRGPLRISGEPPRELKTGTPVIVEITGFPRDPDELPEGRIREVLGIAGLTDVEVRKLKIKHGVVEDFPAPVLAEATRFGPEVAKEDLEGREDLRHIDLLTIDPEDARDHDDAVYAERDGNGYRVIIAIADVSHYVRTGTKIDDEAIARGCSIYLPDRAIPMLPAELSSRLASLVPDVDRLTLAVDVRLDATGRARSHRYIEGVMRSKGRLTYGAVAHTLGLTEERAPDEAQVRSDSHQSQVELLFEVSKLLNKRRKKRGSLDFDLPEARVKLDEAKKEPIDVIRSRKDPGVRQAYNLVEELMLLANEVVATDLEKRGVPAIYRVHGKPDSKKLEQFAAVARAFGHDLGADDAQEPKKLAAFIAKLAGKPESNALSYLLLRAMQQAVYDVTNIGHFGLALRSYLHFTSPIRRYPDLAVHRVVRAIARGERIDGERLQRELHAIALESSRLERRAMELEREVLDLYRCILVRDKVGDEVDATITGVTEHGFYTAFDQPFIEAFTPVYVLGDSFLLDQLGLKLRAQGSGAMYTIGDRIKVRIEEVSIERRQVIVVPAHIAQTGVDDRLPPELRYLHLQPAKPPRHVPRGPAREQPARGDSRRPRRDEGGKGKRQGGPGSAKKQSKKGGGGKRRKR